MARRRYKAVETPGADEAELQLYWARLLASMAGLLRKPDDPLVGGPTREAYEKLSADELRKLAETHPGSSASGQILKHLALSAEAA